MNTTTFEDVKSFILSRASSQELKDVYECYKHRHKLLGVATGLSFKYGDRVWFDAKTRGIIKGKFIKMMSKNAQVLSDTGMTWKVTPSILQREENVTAVKPN